MYYNKLPSRAAGILCIYIYIIPSRSLQLFSLAMEIRQFTSMIIPYRPIKSEDSPLPSMSTYQKYPHFSLLPFGKLT